MLIAVATVCCCAKKICDLSSKKRKSITQYMN